MTVKEVSKLTGVSVRALQYYDRIGLLPPSRRTEAGYRIYGQGDLERLQQILLFRELEFSLEEIRQILASPGFDREKALRQQIDLLTLKKERLDNLITFARGILRNGSDTMSFKAFDTQKQEAYARQAKASWGDADAYKEYAQKSKGRSQEMQNALGAGLMSIFEEMAAVIDKGADSPEAQSLVAKLRSYITEHYYTCTVPILSSLGMMYTTGEFAENIDAAGGAGTAEFAAKAIEIYCKIKA